MKNTRISKFKYAAAPLALGLALISTPSFAQDEAAEEEAGEAIIVTGSRIARPNIEAASPVTVVSAEQVELTGTTTVETLLNELPQVVPGNTRVSNNSGGENFSTIDLRGLGPGRTLILLNGERLPASTTTGVTDVSQIPTGLIERIDVVTGGASAVYGSDAIAGVVNFILKKDYEGVELVGQTSISEDGTGFGFNVSGLVGGNFADGKGNLTVYGSYTDRSSVSQSRYDYSRVSGALLFDPNISDTTGYPARTVTDPALLSTYFPDGFAVISGGGSATPPWGTIAASTLAGTQFRNLATLLPATFAGANTDCNTATPGVNVNSAGSVSFDDARRLAPSVGGSNCTIPIRANGSSRYNFAPQNYLITPYDRLTLTATGRYEFDDKTRLNVYTSFTNANQQVNLAPTPATGIVVTTAAPFIPADLAAALAARTYFARTAGVGASGTAFGAGRFASVGACRTVGTTANDAPAANCVETSAANEPFVINRRFSETGPRDGRFKTTSVNVRSVLEHDLSDNWQVSGVFSYGRVDNSLRGIGNINRTAVAQGLLSCPAGSLPGCVPINLFGADTLTPAMLNFVRIDTQQTESFEQVRVAGNITGSLGELPGGPIGIAAGVEYRKDTGEAIVDDAQRTGDIYGFNAVQSIVGSINVKEVYGEIRLPILDMLSVGAGARYSDYSTVGGLFNWKAEAEFTPTDFLKVRASYNRAARAPNVFELFQNGDQGFPQYVDNCNDTAARSAAVLARCVAAAPGANFTGFQQANGQVQAFAFGNPNLSEEKAETWTAGAVLNFDNVLGGSLTATADYYNIKLTNRVAALGAGFFINSCYSAGDPAACARIVRDQGTGQITSVDTTVTNSSVPLKTSGVDVGLDWSVEALGGRFSLSDTFTFVNSYKLGTLEIADRVFSGLGGVTPRFGNTLTASFRKDGTTVQVRHVWKRGGRQNFAGAELEGFWRSTYDADGNFTGAVDKARIPDLHLVNLSLRQQIGDKLEITAIVNNLLNKYPPITATGYFEQANTNISFYDPYALGRNYTVQARIKF